MSVLKSVAGWLQVEKAPLESYADVGGLEQQIQEIKEAVELPLTHPEVYEDIGIKPPKVSPQKESTSADLITSRISILMTIDPDDIASLVCL